MKNPEWNQAVGSVIHELVHVVQQYKGRVTGWLTEGIADYYRWFHCLRRGGFETPAVQAEP